MYDMFHTELDVTEMSVDTETAHSTLVQIQNKLVQLGVEEYYIPTYLGSSCSIILITKSKILLNITKICTKLNY